MVKGKKLPATVVYINSDHMGRGDDELGALLMGNFLTTLGDFLHDVSHLLLVNAGVRLACEDSDKADILAMLEGSGVEILCCTTCLNHFNIKDRLKTGQVSNMFTIVEILTNARKVITP
ncbi:MAG: sulfurtransferase-like selenium metabolism protein YedF [Desulfobulbaceae bacterium]|nr:sulfurtransferase-like selenium metabolism protein YedF [Desulfobulbaceae bacterium]